MLWRGLTLLKTTHNHCHGSQGASQGNQQSDGHGGGSCGAGYVRLAPMHRSNHWSFQRADKALLDWNDGRQHNARAAAEKRALFYCLSNGLSDLALGE
jgi:hypothetical protein